MDSQHSVGVEDAHATSAKTLPPTVKTAAGEEELLEEDVLDEDALLEDSLGPAGVDTTHTGVEGKVEGKAEGEKADGQEDTPGDDLDATSTPDDLHTAQRKAAVHTAAVAAALAALYVGSPEPTPLAFLVSIAAVFRHALGTAMTQAPRPLYAAVFFSGTKRRERRTSTKLLAPLDKRINWDGEWIAGSAGVGGAKVNVQIRRDTDSLGTLLMGTEYALTQDRVRDCKTHERVIGVPCEEGTVYITVREGPPVPERQTPPANFEEACLSHARACAGRKLYAFYKVHNAEKLKDLAPMLDMYIKREDYLVQTHELAYPWWDWYVDPVEIGDWSARVPMSSFEVNLSLPPRPAHAAAPDARTSRAKHFSPKVI